MCVCVRLCSLAERGKQETEDSTSSKMIKPDPATSEEECADVKPSSTTEEDVDDKPSAGDLTHVHSLTRCQLIGNLFRIVSVV